MFGSFYMGYGTGSPPVPEWNVRADIKASQKFVQSGINVTYAGLDITTFVKLNEEYRMRLWMRQSPLTNALSGLYTLWRFEEYARPDPTLFDVVAVGMVLWPELFTTRDVHIFVDDTGYTRIDPDKKPNGEIGVTIKTGEFLDRVMERYLKQNLMRK
jgi:inosine-uridine nucleoside N-ribohydrolase